MTATGAATTSTFAALVVCAPPTVTVHPSVSVPTAPAVKVTALVPAPAVIAPPVMVHAYVAPACDGTDATSPGMPVVTTEGAEIATTDALETRTFAVPVAVTPAALVTTQVTTRVPGAPAVKVIALVPAPAVMVPPVIDHAYVAPACVGTDALRPVAAVVTAEGTVSVATGAATTSTATAPDAAGSAWLVAMTW
jgi:hypothetical protein